jgi:citrate synthase
MTDATSQRATTAICGYDADHIEVRGKDLITDLMGQRTFTEALLLQALGEEPSPRRLQIVDAVLVTIMEHGLVPSAVVTRLTHYGAPESFQGAVAAGLLGVGDRYAGTAGECGSILERLVAVPEDERDAAAIEEVQAHRKLRRPVPGFGHPIHVGTDPRVERLIAITRDAGANGDFLDAMLRLRDALRTELGKPLVMNISAVIAAALGEAGIPAPLMRGIVLTARCAGLVGHLFEEMRNPAAHAMWESAQDAVDYERP